MMTPSRIASETAATDLASGQCRFMPSGQSRYRDTRYDCKGSEEVGEVYGDLWLG